MRHADFDPLAELYGREKENKDRERAPFQYGTDHTEDDEYELAPTSEEKKSEEEEDSDEKDEREKKEKEE